MLIYLLVPDDAGSLRNNSVSSTAGSFHTHQLPPIPRKQNFGRFYTLGINEI